MTKYLPIALAGLLLFSCQTKQDNTGAASFSAGYDSSFKAAAFTDPQRLEKISKAFPFVDSFYRELAVKEHFPGLVYGIVVDGKLVHTGAVGYTDIEKKIPATEKSVFRIASMSKSFTAMAILKLRDAGKLNLDDPAANYIPALRKLKYPTLDAPAITIRHLLTHGAGFPEDNPWGDRQLADSDAELIALLEKQVSFSNPPGVAYEYSNLGFALLGKIVTEVSGQPYQEYIRKEIWEPLGMQSAEWEYDKVPADKLAHGYRWLNEKWNEETLLHDKADGSWGAMGGMMVSLEDFSKYMIAHLSAWPPSNDVENGPVKRSSIREMHHPWRFNGLNPNFKKANGTVCPVTGAYGYGLGWMMDCEGKVYISHSGGLPGFGSQWRIMPDYGIGVVAFANRTYSGVGGVNMRALDTIISIAGLSKRTLPGSDVLEKRKNELVALLPDWNNAEKSGLFAENFFADYPIDSLRKYAKEYFGKAEKVVSVKPMRAENQLRGSFLIEGLKSDIEIYFTLSPENPAQIQEYHIKEVPKPAASMLK